jgi:hypothetical protein
MAMPWRSCSRGNSSPNEATLALAKRILEAPV